MSKSEQTMSSAPPMEYAQTPQSVPPSYSEAIAQPYPQRKFEHIPSYYHEITFLKSITNVNEKIILSMD